MNQPLILTEEDLLLQPQNILFMIDRSVFKVTCNKCGHIEIIGNQGSSFSSLKNIQKNQDCLICHSDNLSLSVKTKLNHL